MCNDHRWRPREFDHWQKITARIIAGVTVNERIDVVAVGGFQQRVSISGRLQHGDRADIAGRPRTVLNNDLAAEIFRQAVGDDATDHIKATAGAKTNHQQHRLVRILSLHLRLRRRQAQHRQCGGTHLQSLG